MFGWVSWVGISVGIAFLAIWIGDYVSRTFFSSFSVTLFLYRTLVSPLSSAIYAVGHAIYAVFRRLVTILERIADVLYDWVYKPLADFVHSIWVAIREFFRSFWENVRRVLDWIARILRDFFNFQRLIDSFVATCALFGRIFVLPLDFLRGVWGFKYVSGVMASAHTLALNLTAFKIPKILFYTIFALCATIFVGLFGIFVWAMISVSMLPETLSLSNTMQKFATQIRKKP